MGILVDEYTEGWTSSVEYTLLHKDPETGASSTFDASGMTPAVVIKDKDGAAVDTTGDVSWADATESKIRYTPDAADLTASGSPYKLHWKVTDLTGQIAFYPQGTPILLRVFAQ